MSGDQKEIDLAVDELLNAMGSGISSTISLLMDRKKVARAKKQGKMTDLGEYILNKIKSLNHDKISTEEYSVIPKESVGVENEVVVPVLERIQALK